MLSVCTLYMLFSCLYTAFLYSLYIVSLYALF